MNKDTIKIDLDTALRIAEDWWRRSKLHSNKGGNRALEDLGLITVALNGIFKQAAEEHAIAAPEPIAPPYTSTDAELAALKARVAALEAARGFHDWTVTNGAPPATHGVGPSTALPTQPFCF